MSTNTSTTIHTKREVHCKDCGHIVDSQIAVRGFEGMVGSLLTGDSIRMHRLLSGCTCGGVVASDWFEVAA